MDDREPWKSEPDRVDFEHAGYQCAIRREPRHGHLCGFVQVPDGHPAYGEVELDVKVHNGISYADWGHPDNFLEDISSEWWIGFSCHAEGDHLPTYGPIYNDWKYRTIDWVREETQRLADQLRAMAERKEGP